MRYFVAIDGGGTKTHGILADENGKILSELSVGATNPNDTGVEASVLRLSGLVNEITKGITPSVICAGVAGAGASAEPPQAHRANTMTSARMSANAFFIFFPPIIRFFAELPAFSKRCAVSVYSILMILFFIAPVNAVQ